jgi:hypothetical protein
MSNMSQAKVQTLSSNSGNILAVKARLKLRRFSGGLRLVLVGCGGQL